MLKHLEMVRYLTSIAKTLMIYSERRGFSCQWSSSLDKLNILCCTPRHIACFTLDVLFKQRWIPYLLLPKAGHYYRWSCQHFWPCFLLLFVHEAVQKVRCLWLTQLVEIQQISILIHKDLKFSYAIFCTSYPTAVIVGDIRHLYQLAIHRLLVLRSLTEADDSEKPLRVTNLLHIVLLTTSTLTSKAMCSWNCRCKVLPTHSFGLYFLTLIFRVILFPMLSGSQDWHSRCPRRL